MLLPIGTIRGLSLRSLFLVAFNQISQVHSELIVLSMCLLFFIFVLLELHAFIAVSIKRHDDLLGPVCVLVSPLLLRIWFREAMALARFAFIICSFIVWWRIAVSGVYIGPPGLLIRTLLISLARLSRHVFRVLGRLG